MRIIEIVDSSVQQGNQQAPIVVEQPVVEQVFQSEEEQKGDAPAYNSMNRAVFTLDPVTTDQVMNNVRFLESLDPIEDQNELLNIALQYDLNIHPAFTYRFNYLRAGHTYEFLREELSQMTELLVLHNLDLEGDPLEQAYIPALKAEITFLRGYLKQMESQVPYIEECKQRISPYVGFKAASGTEQGEI